MNKYSITEIKSELSLPYDIIEINKGNWHEGNVIEFKIRLYEIPQNQTEESIKYGGIDANFDMVLNTGNIKANIFIDTTVGNMYKFYKELSTSFEKLDGKAVLKNYGNSRCNLVVKFSKNGHCNVSGFVNDESLNGVNVDIDIDQSYCYQWLKNFKMVFDELERIQGDGKFVY